MQILSGVAKNSIQFGIQTEGYWADGPDKSAYRVAMKPRNVVGYDTWRTVTVEFQEGYASMIQQGRGLV